MKRTIFNQGFPAILAVLAIAVIGPPEASSGPNASATITVQPIGSGSGRVVSTPSTIDCPGACSADFRNLFDAEVVPATGVELSASPGPGNLFLGWGGPCSGSGSCRIPDFSGTKYVTARFEPVPIGTKYLVSVSVAGSGSGTVTGAGISCPGDCSETIAKGAAVVFAATASGGSSFASWGGACSGSAPTCSLTMDAAKSVTATFDAAAPPPGGGTPPPPGNPGNPAPPWNPGQPGLAGPPTPERTCTIVGTSDDDVLTGTPGRDVICGLGGNDTLLGGSGDDLLDAGSGADVLVGGAGNDRLAGGAGRDTLAGGLGNDRLAGDRGMDRLNGERGIDVIYARDRGRDRIDGGPGLDRARVDRTLDERKRVESVF